MTQMTKKQKKRLEKYKKIEHKDILISITNFSDEVVYEEPSPTNPYARMRLYEAIFDSVDDFSNQDITDDDDIDENSSWYLTVSSDQIILRRLRENDLEIIVS